MSKKSETKRRKALLADPSIYRREAIPNCISIDLLKHSKTEYEITIAGRIILRDVTGKISQLGIFSRIDGQQVINLEIISANGFWMPAYLTYSPENVEFVDHCVHYGDFIQLTGVLKNTKEGEVFLAHSVCVLSKAVGDLYNSTLDVRSQNDRKVLEIARNPSQILEFRQYASIHRMIRMFLYNAEYEEIPLPIMQDYFEAGLADPFMTFSNDSKRNLYLRLTGELYLRRLMVAGFTKVFELGRSFRNQSSSKVTKPEFSILELYSAYATKEEMKSMLRKMVLLILDNVYDCFLIPTDYGHIDCGKTWDSVSFSEEYKRVTGKKYGQNISDADIVNVLLKEGVKMPSVVNEYTLNNAIYNYLLTKWQEPTWLVDLPKSKSPLNKVNDDNLTIDESFLVINGMLTADLVNAERDPRVFSEALKKQLAYCEGSDKQINQDFVNLMNYGVPPCMGIGMGIERLLMLIFNKKNILDASIFC